MLEPEPPRTTLGSPPAPSTTSPAPTSDLSGETSALATIKKFFAENGIPESLGVWAWDRLLQGASIDEIYLDMRDRPEYIARFPALAEMRKQGSGMNEAQYIQQENAYKEVMHAYGLPKGFYDSPDDFGAMITGRVSPTELRDRVQTYSQAVLGDAETLTQLRTLYADAGIPRSAETDLLAYYLDPNRAAPILQQQYDAAQFSAAAAKSGFGQLSKAQAETFGARQGVSAEQAQQGFGALVQSRELFNALPGQGEKQIGEQVQLGAAFGGDALAQEEIEKRRRSRLAAAGGGGSFSATQRGVSALGSNEV